MTVRTVSMSAALLAASLAAWAAPIPTFKQLDKQLTKYKPRAGLVGDTNAHLDMDGLPFYCIFDLFLTVMHDTAHPLHAATKQAWDRNYAAFQEQAGFVAVFMGRHLFPLLITTSELYAKGFQEGAARYAPKFNPGDYRRPRPAVVQVDGKKDSVAWWHAASDADGDGIGNGDELRAVAPNWQPACTGPGSTQRASGPGVTEEDRDRFVEAALGCESWRKRAALTAAFGAVPAAPTSASILGAEPASEPEPGAGHALAPGDESRDDRPASRRWFSLLTLANAYPALESERLIDQFFNTPMRILAPDFDDVTTFGDLRDWSLLWTPSIGLGYVISDHLAAFLAVGYGAGPVRTKADNTSIFLLPLHTDLELKRAAFIVIPGLDIFPFGMVEQREYRGLKDRLGAAKPMVGLRLPWTYASYEADVKFGFKPFGNLVSIEQSDAWAIWSVNVNLGVDVPVDKRNQINFNFGHSFFAERNYDFGGPTWSVSWKRLF